MDGGALAIRIFPIVSAVQIKVQNFYGLGGEAAKLFGVCAPEGLAAKVEFGDEGGIMIAPGADGLAGDADLFGDLTVGVAANEKFDGIELFDAQAGNLLIAVARQA